MSAILIIASVLGVLLALGWLSWYLVAAPSSQIICPTIVAGPRHEIPIIESYPHATASTAKPDRGGEIALTFDDGPGEDTPRILDILREHEIKATFFLCGKNVERYPALAQRIAAEGHEIGNHAYSHRSFLWRSPGWIKQEIEQTQRLIGRACGLSEGSGSNDTAHPSGGAGISGARALESSVKRPLLFRPPYGLRWFGLAPILRSLGMKAVMWDVNSLDWKNSAAEISSRVARQTRPGSIILLHDGIPPGESGRRLATVQALPAIVAALRPVYRFRTISQWPDDVSH